jgi:hypothetical protein
MHLFDILPAGKLTETLHDPNIFRRSEEAIVFLLQHKACQLLVPQGLTFSIDGLLSRLAFSVRRCPACVYPGRRHSAEIP